LTVANCCRFSLFLLFPKNPLDFRGPHYHLGICVISMRACAVTAF
jgi:hypothetical protein